MTRWLTLALAALAALVAMPAAAQRAPHPLFADPGIIQLTITGPLRDLIRAAERSEEAGDATLTLGGARPETHAVRLSPRGISRRRRDVCPFPPLRIEFRERPRRRAIHRAAPAEARHPLPARGIVQQLHLLNMPATGC